MIKASHISIALNLVQFAYIFYLNTTINDLKEEVALMNHRIEKNVTEWEAFRHFYCQCIEQVPDTNPYKTNGMAKICNTAL